MLRLSLLLLSCSIMFGLVARAQGVAVVYGKIAAPVSFNNDGKMIPYGVRFFSDNLVEQAEWGETVDSTGHFSISLPLTQGSPISMEYNYQTVSLFLSPNDTLYMTFEGDKLISTLKYTGNCAAANNYLANFARRFDLAIEEESLEQKIDFVARQVFANYCEDFRAQQSGFLQEYLRLNKNTSTEFQQWAKADIKYRAANRVQQFYFASDNKQSDDYRSFAMNYNLNEVESLASVQYQQFLDNNLRQLSMRDPQQLRAERELRNQPWVVRGLELARQHHKGTTLDFVNAKLLLNLIEAEYPNTPAYYNDWLKTNPLPRYRATVDKKYQRFTEFLSAPPPADAHLVVVNSQNPLTLQQILQQYSGKIMVMDFWASWCKPCLSELPYSTLLHDALKDKDVVFVYFSADEAAAEGKWRGNVARYALAGEHYLMNPTLQAELYKALGVQFIPHYAIVDKKGQIINANAPKPSNPELRQRIEELLQGN